MDIRSTDPTNLYFKKSIGKGDRRLTLDADMLRLLAAIDPKRNLSAIAADLKMPTLNLRQALAKLLNLNLIVQIAKPISCLDVAVFFPPTTLLPRPAFFGCAFLLAPAGRDFFAGIG